MEPLTIDGSRSALVVIDLQKGIVAMPAEPYSTESVIKNTVAIAEACRKKSIPIFLVHVGPSPDMKDMLQPEADQPMQRSGQMPDDWTEIIPQLGPKAEDHLILKHQWGAFYGTDLDLQLRRRGIDTIILCGIATNIGVESTARFAFEYGYQQIFVEDACTARSKLDHQQSFQSIFPRIGRVRSTKEVVAVLQ